ncbi:uncharacterized protein UV8b_06692 [Ustilaginoidea virens]|uniref:Uncharacterized protein n=1 Tax=Ustilaginoidea virens TaxID=1159556 RepID=A0A8E5HVS2_USTVR|nr:uncharacterized protein UV8b_06692 [Ustilaginoidea virens]QUC22451.1 hypothetical protein UV8b_06692 [Ustilaginoidea virens]
MPVKESSVTKPVGMDDTETLPFSPKHASLKKRPPPAGHGLRITIRSRDELGLSRETEGHDTWAILHTVRTQDSGLRIDDDDDDDDDVQVPSTNQLIVRTSRVPRDKMPAQHEPGKRKAAGLHASQPPVDIVLIPRHSPHHLRRWGRTARPGRSGQLFADRRSSASSIPLMSDTAACHPELPPSPGATPTCRWSRYHALLTASSASTALPPPIAPHCSLTRLAGTVQEYRHHAAAA